MPCVTQTLPSSIPPTSPACPSLSLELPGGDPEWPPRRTTEAAPLQNPALCLRMTEENMTVDFIKLCKVTLSVEWSRFRTHCSRPELLSPTTRVAQCTQGNTGGKPGARQGFQSQLNSLLINSPSHGPQSPRLLAIGSAPRPGLSPPWNILTWMLSRLHRDGGLLHWQISVMLWLGKSRKAAIMVKLWRVMRTWAVIYLINTHSNVQKNHSVDWKYCELQGKKKDVSQKCCVFTYGSPKKKIWPFLRWLPANISAIFPCVSAHIKWFMSKYSLAGSQIAIMILIVCL